MTSGLYGGLAVVLQNGNGQQAKIQKRRCTLITATKGHRHGPKAQISQARKDNRPWSCAAASKLPPMQTDREIGKTSFVPLAFLAFWQELHPPGEPHFLPNTWPHNELWCFQIFQNNLKIAQFLFIHFWQTRWARRFFIANQEPRRTSVQDQYSGTSGRGKTGLLQFFFAKGVNRPPQLPVGRCCRDFPAKPGVA
jgi:hypothetical protein